jgi:aryl-alcohol dehydrogenase-like predicted oxidoreductase
MGMTVDLLAIARVLAHDGVTGAIVEARIAEHVRGWIPAPSISLEQPQLEAIAVALETTGAGEGPPR